MGRLIGSRDRDIKIREIFRDTERKVSETLKGRRAWKPLQNPPYCPIKSPTAQNSAIGLCSSLAILEAVLLGGRLSSSFVVLSIMKPIPHRARGARGSVDDNGGFRYAIS